MRDSSKNVDCTLCQGVAANLHPSADLKAQTAVSLSTTQMPTSDIDWSGIDFDRQVIAAPMEAVSFTRVRAKKRRATCPTYVGHRIIWDDTRVFGTESGEERS